MARRLRIYAVLLTMAMTSALAGCGGSSDSDGPDSTATATATATTATTPVTGDAAELGPAFGDMDDLPGVLKTPPPWDANTARLQQRLRAIGLPALTEEGQLVHIHQHLDVFFEGKPVKVADDIGIASDRTFISPLHTHQQNQGIVHVESPTESRYGLGQFFAVWGVRLDARCLGAGCAGDGKRLRAWVNGTEVRGDPTRIVLEEHQEIVLAYGTPEQMPDPVPSSYAFPAGL